MTQRVHIDRFSSLDHLPAKDRGNDIVVLGTLNNAKRFSCFEASECPALARTINRLRDAGHIKLTDELGYPWHAVEITESGRSLLNGGKR